MKPLALFLPDIPGLAGDWERGYVGPGNEAMWGLGMRLVVAWEWDYVGPGNEASGGLGMRLRTSWLQ